MQIKYFFGIDVSKSTLDVTVVVEGKSVDYQKLENRTAAIKKVFLKRMHSLGATMEDSVFCMEHTGLYNLPLVKWLHSQNGMIWLESGLQIRKASGMLRGKNDQVDSGRIAQYAYTHRHQIKVWSPPREVIQRLSVLLSQRARFEKVLRQLTTAQHEQTLFLDKTIVRMLDQHNRAPIEALRKQIRALEEQIQEILRDDESLERLYRIITSIHGIGLLTAGYIIVSTNEFRSIRDPKKYACYSGVAPFEYSSGSSVRGKTRVSRMANKNIKQLLHLAAMSSIRAPGGELSEYYQRKVAEGKNKMSVLNAVRNKLILRVFACVNQNREYQKKYGPCVA